jgi:hypothetical protein
MKASNARIAFFIICLALAVLLVMKVLTTILTGALFALALVTLGLASRGFRKKE